MTRIPRQRFGQFVEAAFHVLRAKRAMAVIPASDAHRYNRRGRLAVPKDEDAPPPVLGLIDNLGEVGLDVREGALLHVTNMTYRGRRGKRGDGVNSSIMSIRGEPPGDTGTVFELLGSNLDGREDNRGTTPQLREPGWGRDDIASD